MSRLDFHKKLEMLLLALLKKLSTSNLLLLSIENIEQIILLVGLEQIRYSLNIHFRGLALGCAPRLDHLLNLVRLNLGDDYYEGMGTTVIKHNQITAWNDVFDDKPDHERSHMVHLNVQMVCGFGLNVATKQGWNGVDLQGIRITEKEIKRHLRVIKYNEEKSATYNAPHFNIENGTYNFAEVNYNFYDDIENALIPVKKQQDRKLFIR